MKTGDMTIVVRIKVEMSFWDALKLRLAGIRSELIEDNISRTQSVSKSEEKTPINYPQPNLKIHEGTDDSLEALKKRVSEHIK